MCAWEHHSAIRFQVPHPFLKHTLASLRCTC
uniref:Uncharacterized protein n=1 Tax=Anguilla anguilla TaxID=7936 RepID=A0A0E9U8W3_ANGAN